MQSPKLTYEQMKRITGIEDVAYKRLFENYLKIGLKGDAKRIDIESTDQESLLNKSAFNRPVIGMVYTFIHINENTLGELQNMSSGKSIQFHDYTPILFCTNFNPLTSIIKGLNLNMLPSSERVKFFEAFYNEYKQFFERIEEKTEYQKEAKNKKYEIAALMGRNPAIFQKFNKEQNSLFNFAYRSYNLKNVAKFRMIEIEEWKYIPFFNAKESFKKANLDTIYRTYWDNKNKTK